MPWPYGGKQRADHDRHRSRSASTRWGLSPRDVNNALSAQNVIVPTGHGEDRRRRVPDRPQREPRAARRDRGASRSRSSTARRSTSATSPTCATATRRRRTSSTSTGKKSVLMSILKQGEREHARHRRRASATCCRRRSSRLPKELKVDAALRSVGLRARGGRGGRQGGGDRRRPDRAHAPRLPRELAEHAHRPHLDPAVDPRVDHRPRLRSAQTLNVMTLGGLSLAVGILVDDATVEIENVHRNMAQKKPIVQAILDGAAEIATPAFVSTLCICIVFVPVVFITGAAKSLFMPLAMAVVFAMLTSYFLSRTLVPTMMRYLLREGGRAPRHRIITRRRRRSRGRFFAAFERGFERLRDVLRRLAGAGRSRTARLVVAGFLVLRRGCRSRLFPLVGRDFFPTRRRRAHQAPRARRAGHAHRGDGAQLRADRGHDPRRSSRRARSRRCSTTSASRTAASTCRSARARSSRRPTARSSSRSRRSTARPPDYVRKLRATLAHDVSRTQTFFFLAPDISTQVLNFGLAAPIDVQVVGAIGNEDADLRGRAADRRAREAHPRRGRRAPRAGPEAARAPHRRRPDDGRAARPHRARRGQRPARLARVERHRVAELLARQARRPVPRRRADAAAPRSTRSTRSNTTPISTGGGAARSSCRTSRRCRAPTGPVNITHYNVARTYDVQANVDGTDLGSVADARRRRWSTSSSPRCRAGRPCASRGRSRAWSRRSAASATGSSSRSCSSTC